MSDERRRLTVVGLISGTSMDGIDVAAAEFALEGETLVLRPLGSTSIPYTDDLRSELEAALPPASISAGTLCRLDNLVGQAFASAARTGIDTFAPNADLVASHGQTLYHWVEDGRAKGSLQIGQPAWIAERTGLSVVADLRVADIAAQGEGAPLAGLFDALLLAGGEGSRAALNIGGISNITVIGLDSTVLAYDIGPGNALIDSAVSHITGGDMSYDPNGEIGKRGHVHQPLLEKLLDEPYYRKEPPKTTGKELFHLPYLLEAVEETGEVADEDLVATVTALTALTIANDCKSHRVDEVIVGGGGALNLTLMRILAEELSPISIRPIDDLGIPAPAKESYFIALTGYFSLNGLPGNLPSATGAKRPVVLGCLLAGESGFRVPEAVTTAPTRLEIVTDGRP